MEYCQHQARTSHGTQFLYCSNPASVPWNIASYPVYEWRCGPHGTHWIQKPFVYVVEDACHTGLAFLPWKISLAIIFQNGFHTSNTSYYITRFKDVQLHPEFCIFWRGLCCWVGMGDIQWQPPVQPLAVWPSIWPWDRLGPKTLHCSACTWTHLSSSNKIQRTMWD